MDIDASMEQILLIQRLALRFVMAREMLPVFIEWAHRNHDTMVKQVTGKPCDDPDCQYSNPDPAKWESLLNQAFFVVLTASNINDNGG